MSGSVTRMWQAHMARSDIADWVETFRARAFPGMRAVDGFRRVTFLAERGADPCRVTVLTEWDDMDAVRRYAGEDPGRTVMPDFMARFFADYDPRATFHDQLLAEATA